MSATRVVDVKETSSRISDAEFASVQGYVDAIIDRLAALHLSVAIETDFNALFRFISSRAGAIINPTFNPFENMLDRDSYWLRVINSEGDVVACHAQRMFVVEDFCDLVRSGRLFSETWEPVDPARTQVIPPTVTVRGRIAYAGSLWVDNEHRKKGLSVWLPYLSRLACLRNFEPDFFTACIFEKIAHSGVAERYYGYTHVEPITTGYSSITRGQDTMYVCYMSWRDAVDKIHLLATHPQYPIDPAG